MKKNMNIIVILSFCLIISGCNKKVENKNSETSESSTVVSESSKKENVNKILEDFYEATISINNSIVEANSAPKAAQASENRIAKPIMPDSSSIPVQEIRTILSSLTIEPGSKYAVVCKTIPKEIENDHLWIQSSDETVIKVSGRQLKAVGQGTARITITATSGASTSINITVNK